MFVALTLCEVNHPVSALSRARDHFRDAVHGSVLRRARSVRTISARSSAAGRLTYRSLSSRPGRHIAGSSMSGRFVAVRTKTPRRESRQSSSVRSVLATCAEDSESVSSRRGTSTSSPSKKMIHGEGRTRTGEDLTNCALALADVLYQSS